MDKKHTILSMLVMVYVTVMLITIVMAYRIIELFDVSIVASTLILPIWLMIESIITEVFGYAVTRKIIWMSLFCEFLFIFTCYLLIHLPSPAFWKHEASYIYVFNRLPRVFVGSFLGILVGAFTNAYVVSKWKYC